MALDKVNNRLFIGHHGPSRYDIYQLDENGLPLRRHADYSIGRSLIGRGFSWLGTLGKKYLNAPGGADFDPVHQRLFISDRGRILVFDLHPDSLKKLKRGDFPEAFAVLGQPDFDTRETEVGPNIGSGTTLVDAEHQRLFVADSRNNRILVWDIRPEKLENGMDAMAVIGQPDFYTNKPGVGRNRFRPGSITYDPVKKHLFVADGANQRVLVFDVSPENLRNGMDAMAVIGQSDFMARGPRKSLRKLRPERIALDYKYHRLFVGEQFGNRLLVFDVDPSQLKEAQDPDPIAVLGQPDFGSTDPAISQTRMTMSRVTIDSELQLAYMPDGYPAGNRINIMDISPETMKRTLTPILDQIGHVNPEGEADFMSRSANDRTSPRFWTQGRDVAIDTVDHRLFLSDNYGHRVLIFQLDRMNRIQDRDAKWVLGQPDVDTSHVLPGRTASSIKLPLAVEYDESHKRLFVADTWNDRILVFDMTPGRVHSGMEASYVLGQADFTSRDVDPELIVASGVTQVIRATRNRFYFASREGAGIYPSQSRAAEIAMDKTNQRLFITDGGHQRVMVFDVHPDRIRSGADAIAVIGQKDFTSTEEGLSGNRWRLPGDLAFDQEHQRLFVEVPWQNRVLVFDVSPGKLANNTDIRASLVIGQPDFTSDEPGLSRSKFRQPDGISYDALNDRLLITDKYHDRILIFDARPEVLKTLPEAIGVVGEIDFDQVRTGTDNPRLFQDRLYDPRGNAFDSENQRFFQTESLNTRLTVFTLPREQFRVDLPARASLKYESLDALTKKGAEDLMVGHSAVELEEAAPVLGISTHLLTRRVIHRESERESRLLISEAQLPALKAATETQLFFDNRKGARLSLSVVNPNSAAVSVDFKLKLHSGEQLQTNRQIGAGEQLSVEAGQLFGGILQQSTGSLWIESSGPVQVGALLELPNGKGDSLTLAAPLAHPEEITTQRRVLPKVVSGAGYRMAYVLMNPTRETMRGTLEIEGGRIPYSIDPQSIFYHEEDEVAQPLQTSYAVARTQSGGVPVTTGLLRLRRRDGTLQTARVIGSNQEGTLFWAPVNTYPSMLRHGAIESRISIVNEGPVPATVYLELFDVDGNSGTKYERIVPLGKRIEMGLEDVFGESRLRGTLRVFSDSEVSLSLERRVVNIEDELILSDIPLQRTPESEVNQLVFPVFSNGSGMATELQMINTGRSAIQGRLSIKTPQGTVVKTVLN